MATIAEYRRVNYYELCRLCTGSGGTKMHIFREEGRRRTLQQKIQTCLPLSVKEEDSLPKIVCSTCVEKLEGYFNFRESCINAEAMLESYFSSLCFTEDVIREGKFPVYVKDDKKKMENAGKRKDQTVSAEEAPPSTIQILSNQEGNRMNHCQYKIQVQNGVPSFVTAYPSLPSAPASVHRTDGTQTEQNIPQPVLASMTVAQELFTGQEGIRPGVEGTLALPTGGHIRLDPEQLSQLLVSGASLQFTVKPEQQRRENKVDKPAFAELGLKFEGDIPVDGNQQTAAASEAIKITEEQPESPAEQEEDPDDDQQQQSRASSQDGANREEGEVLPFQCELCPKSFRRREHWSQHKKSHTGLRPFSCGLCGKAFSRKEHLLRHKVAHTGTKQFTCDICQKSFSRKDNLHKHKKTHGVSTGPFHCETCGKSFQVRHYYSQHKLTHRQTDDQKDDIKKSEQNEKMCSTSASNPLPYQCDICVKSFSRPNLLFSHKQRHRGKTAAAVGKNTAAQPERVQVQTTTTVQQPQPTQQQVQQQPQHTTILTGFPINTGLTTINPHALLAPNIVHSAGIMQMSNSYVCTPDFLDQCRRLQSS